MIITGIIIIAAALILSLLNVLFIAGSAAADSDGGLVAGIGLHVVLGIAYVVGLAITAIGIVEALT